MKIISKIFLIFLVSSPVFADSYKMDEGFYVEEPIAVSKEADEKEVERIENLLTEKMNFAQEESLRIAQNTIPN